jgi:hypothetical protein
MKFCLFIIFSLWFISISNAQAIEAKIIDASTSEWIPFVNIGILGKNVGTVSDIEGGFKLNVPKEGISPHDTLRFSSIGYGSIDFLVKDISSMPSVIKMKKVSLPLPMVTINPNNFNKLKELGHPLASDKIVFYFLSNKLGTELATLIKVKKGKLFLKKAHFNISENKFGEIYFRVNLYESKNRKPAERLINEEIIVKTSLGKGTLSLDLAKYNLVVDSDFFLSLEWVRALNNGKITEELKFCAGLGKGTIFTKSTSHAAWKEFTQKKYGFKPLLGFYVEASEEK